MNALAVALALLIANSEPSCLARKSAVSTSSVPTFRTELECELWETVVLLEGDVRTATTAEAECVTALHAVVPEIVEAPAAAAVVPSPGLSPPWAAITGGAVGVAVGVIVGVLLSRGIEVKL